MPTNTYTEKIAIKQWAEEDRPREKMLIQGRQALSNAELLAILIGSGSANESAVALSQRILNLVKNNLQELGKQNIAELTKFKGIGEAKAIAICAALELGRRRQLESALKRISVESSQDAYNVMAPILGDLMHEEFWIMLFNRSNKWLANVPISAGGVAGTVVDAKIIFKKAIEHTASSIILCHNHPSGNTQPSEADIEITKKLKQAGEVLDIQILDHLIVTQRAYYSFADEGKL